MQQLGRQALGWQGWPSVMIHSCGRPSDPLVLCSECGEPLDIREPDATTQPAPQDHQLMSKHRVFSFKPQLRLERRGQDGQNETEQPDHFASLGNSITSSTRIRSSVHTGAICSSTGSPYPVVLFSRHQ
jgi:hypothetical protein